MPPHWRCPCWQGDRPLRGAVNEQSNISSQRFDSFDYYKELKRLVPNHKICEDVSKYNSKQQTHSEEYNIFVSSNVHSANLDLVYLKSSTRGSWCSRLWGVQCRRRLRCDVCLLEYLNVKWSPTILQL